MDVRGRRRTPTIHNQVGFQSSPAVVDGTVYVGCRDAHVYALDAATGRKKWDYPTSKSWVNGTPAVRDGRSTSARRTARASWRSTRAPAGWRFNFDAKSYVFSSAALAGELAYFGSHNGKLYAVDAQNRPAGLGIPDRGFENATPSISLNADGSLNQEAFTPVFGDFQDMYIDFYRFIVGRARSWVRRSIDQGVLYVGSLDGNLYALR